MIVKWGIEDGYQDGGREWETEIPDEEIKDLSNAEVEEVVIEWVNEDFQQYVTWYIKEIEDGPEGLEM